MKANSLKEIKTELTEKNKAELIQLCIKLVKLRKENKEMLSFLLFGAENVQSYIDDLKILLQNEFTLLNFPARQKLKHIRKTLRTLKKHIRYIEHLESEIHLRLWFCQTLIDNCSHAEIRGAYQKLIQSEIRQIENKIPKLHEDLIFDSRQELEEIKKQL